MEFCLKENSKLLCLEIILDCRWCNNICSKTLIICNRKLVHVQNLNYPSLNLFNKFQLIMHSRNVSYDVIRKIIQIQITWQCGYFENKVFSWIWKFMFIKNRMLNQCIKAVLLTTSILFLRFLSIYSYFYFCHNVKFLFPLVE